MNNTTNTATFAIDAVRALDSGEDVILSATAFDLVRDAWTAGAIKSADFARLALRCGRLREAAALIVESERREVEQMAERHAYQSQFSEGM